MGSIVLKGITWGHSRGLVPLQAVSQRFSELHPGVEIQWSKRTLQEFADFPIEKLTTQYDLLIIDHPWVGRASALVCVLPLDQHLSSSFLKDQYLHSIGHSHESYYYNGHQWALAIDAATPVASYRKDLLDQHQETIPQTWEEVLTLAEAGRVAVPAIPIDLLMNFYGFCIARGALPFQSDSIVVDDEIGKAALETMFELYRLVDPVMFQANPIKVAELMTQSDQYWYCPFAYGYSNYSREGYAPHLLHYTDVVRYGSEKIKTTLGGTGLAVSAYSENKALALEFAQMVASPSIQQTLYGFHGGQPGHAAAWDAEALNVHTHQYFRNTRPTLDRAYMRPRYNGYLHFQDHAGDPVQACMQGKLTPEKALEKINELYRWSKSNPNK